MQITKNHNSYPYLLKQIHSAPQKLYYKGNIKLLKKTCLSIVGTRKYSQYGAFTTNKIVKELSVLDIAIVSGLAKGIDTIAHKAAIENSLPTIAVLGSGIDNIYPKENSSLAEKLIKKNLILSEYPEKEEPKKTNFPQRNRIVSGLSVATIVIEAPKKSGALITAQLALEQGREIFVVPGDIDRRNSTGILHLLQKGSAYPISSGEDVIEILKIQPYLFDYNNCKRDKPPKHLTKKQKTDKIYNFTAEESAILKSMPLHRKISLDKIKKKTALETSTILSTLSILEIKNLICTKDGKYLRRC